MSGLRVEGLVKRFGDVPIVDEATFEAAPGELSVILGPTGSGKSLLARLIRGLDLPDEGEVFLDGRLARPGGPDRRNIGLVPENDSLWPHLTAAENIAAGLRARGVSRRDTSRRVADAISNLGIEGVVDRRPEDLTPLQRLRAEFARAVVLEPDVLLVDEPFARLDDRARDDLRDDLRRLCAESDRTIVVFTREASDALPLADRLSVIDLGRIVQSGPPREVYERPASLFVAQFLGPANIVQGQIESVEPDMVVRTPLGALRLESEAPTSPPPGTPVSLCIRPESVRVTTAPASGPNRFPATIERQVFRGPTIEVALRGPGDWPISAVCLRGESLDWREGQAFTIEIPPDQAVLLGGRYAASRVPSREI